ncbi:hypothetical protein GYO_3676 [Bacillus spizizenii TU-B-10]|uniref:Uncharacterized protein n=1 Tax=Bacillus spizizenii (strain DSM 15029 / JCM 12233 / NBRC 101239 / NRRL B-23049 / TU-B-10) TaxID=1052585 RepID=G4P0S2_BACS4|nr:hypothetical protein GYO_3676 [Bacillus spizizenii TU-B-10]
MKSKERSETVKKASKGIVLDSKIRHVLYCVHEQIITLFF